MRYLLLVSFLFIKSLYSQDGPGVDQIRQAVFEAGLKFYYSGAVLPEHNPVNNENFIVIDFELLQDSLVLMDNILIEMARAGLADALNSIYNKGEEFLFIRTESNKKANQKKSGTVYKLYLLSTSNSDNGKVLFTPKGPMVEYRELPDGRKRINKVTKMDGECIEAGSVVKENLEYEAKQTKDGWQNAARVKYTRFRNDGVTKLLEEIYDLNEGNLKLVSKVRYDENGNKYDYPYLNKSLEIDNKIQTRRKLKYHGENIVSLFTPEDLMQIHSDKVPKVIEAPASFDRERVDMFIKFLNKASVSESGNESYSDFVPVSWKEVPDDVYAELFYRKVNKFILLLQKHNMDYYICRYDEDKNKSVYFFKAQGEDSPVLQIDYNKKKKMVTSSSSFYKNEKLGLSIDYKEHRTNDLLRITDRVEECIDGLSILYTASVIYNYNKVADQGTADRSNSVEVISRVSTKITENSVTDRIIEKSEHIYYFRPGLDNFTILSTNVDNNIGFEQEIQFSNLASTEQTILINSGIVQPRIRAERAEQLRKKASEHPVEEQNDGRYFKYYWESRLRQDIPASRPQMSTEALRNATNFAEKTVKMYIEKQGTDKNKK